MYPVSITIITWFLLLNLALIYNLLASEYMQSQKRECNDVEGIVRVVWTDKQFG